MNNVSSTTTKVYLAVVHQLHISQGLPTPPIAGMAKLNQVLWGIRVCESQAMPGDRKRLSMTPDLLHRIKAHWEAEGITYDKIMLWAAFTTCFFGFLRSGEICSKLSQSFDSSEGMLVDCVAVNDIQNPTMIRLYLKVSKTDRLKQEWVSTCQALVTNCAQWLRCCHG